MTRDLPPPIADETDAELSALFATLKDDRAPPDLEARLLTGLAAVTVASAGTAAVKLTLWKKVVLWLGTSGLTKSVIVGALCGGAVSGAITVVDAPDRLVAAEVSGIGAGPVVPPAGSSAAISGDGKGASGSDGAEVLGAPGVGAPGGEETPERERNGPGGTAVRPASAAFSSSVATSGSEVAASAATSVAVVASGGGASSAAPPRGSAGASDGLRRELLLVRGIAALVDAGRCPEARAAIAAYHGENRAGQLAGEVDVLAARCQGR